MKADVVPILVYLTERISILERDKSEALRTMNVDVALGLQVSIDELVGVHKAANRLADEP